MTAVNPTAARPRVRPRAGPDQWTMAGGLVLVSALLVLFLALPLYALLSQGFEDKSGAFVGLANFTRFLETPALSRSIANSVQVAAISAFITIVLAFVYAYALTRSAMPAKGLFKA